MVICLISMLNICHLPWPKGHRVPVLVHGVLNARFWLRNYSGQCKPRSICLELSSHFGIKMMQHWGCWEGGLQLLKCFACRWGKFKWTCLLPPLAAFKKVSDGCNNLWILEYESSVEICETQKLLDFHEGGGPWPFHDSCDMIWVHWYSFCSYNETKVLNRSSGKDALLQIRIKLILP